MVNNGVDLVLVGHFHHYERFADLNASGQPVTSGARTREIIVGTGGESEGPFPTPIAGSEVRIRAFGILAVTLGSGSYTWKFKPADPSGRRRRLRELPLTILHCAARAAGCCWQLVSTRSPLETFADRERLPRDPVIRLPCCHSRRGCNYPTITARNLATSGLFPGAWQARLPHPGEPRP